MIEMRGKQRTDESGEHSVNERGEMIFSKRGEIEAPVRDVRKWNIRKLALGSRIDRRDAEES
ncbi:hypothetical protein [Bradyrhizobium sp. HKCCYLS20291]|uniref:hypothetical protein n=1 Tax=Bradyrhizobium sp. HKCCYLS20291 TaxID=3420766 RepID=UPI003EC0A347